MNEENKVKCSAYGDNPQECELYPDCDDCSGNITKLDMTQEERNLLTQDLCARLPYGVIVHYKSQEKEGDVVLGYGNISYVPELGEGWWFECKPYLRPMSSMTEEEEKQFQDVNLYELPYRVEGLDWLNAHHFDYRGLINDGLALEAKEGMYNN